MEQQKNKMKPFLVSGCVAVFFFICLMGISVLRFMTRDDLYYDMQKTAAWFVRNVFGYTILFSALLSVIVFFSALWVCWTLQSDNGRKTVLWKCVFVAVVLILAVALADRHGIMVDLPIERTHCQVSFKYLFQTYTSKIEIFNDVPNFENYYDRYYGVAVQMPMTFLEALLHFSLSLRTVFYMRNIYHFVLFAAGAAAFYYLIRRMFGARTAVLAGLFYIVNPRILPSSFTNMKDTVFMSLLSVGFCVFNMVVHSEVKPRRSFILKIFGLSVITAFMISSRTIGGLLAIAGELYFAVMAVKHKSEKKEYLLAALYYFVFSVVIFLAVTPASWSNPISYCIKNLTTFSDFDWAGTNLYMGQRLGGKEMPWHYVPVMIFITTPLIYQILIIVGSFLAARGILKRAYGKNTVILMTSLGIVLFTFLYIFLAKPTLYSEWRHFYYLWTCFVILAAAFLDWASRQRLMIQRTGMIITAAGVLFTAAYIIMTYPYEGNFHNLFVKNFNADNYSMKGVRSGYREGVQYIVSRYYEEGGQPLKVARQDELEYYLFDRDTLSAVEFVEENAQFYVRVLPRTKDDEKYRDLTEIHSKTVDGIEVFRIYKK